MLARFSLWQLLAMFVIRYEFKKGVHSGGVLFWYWFLHAVLGIVPFRSLIINITYDDNVSVCL